jgi:hypothetical protein
VIFTSIGSETTGETYTLTCSSTLADPIPIPTNIPSPTFHWYFGPTGDAPLPPGVTLMATTSSSYTYSSTLVFSPLSQSHAGTYTCRLGAGSLAANITIMNGSYYYIIKCTVFRPYQAIRSKDGYYVHARALL